MSLISYNSTDSASLRQYVALATQCVGVGSGGSVSMLARVSLTDYRGNVIMDTFVAPTTTIVNYRTATTGIESRHFMENVKAFTDVQNEIAIAIYGRTLVGHSLWADLQVLGISHPAIDTRDTALFLPFRQALKNPNQIIGLQTLVWHLMRRTLGSTVQDSLENTRGAMDLFRSHEQEWESVIKSGQWPCALPPASFARCYS